MYLVIKFVAEKYDKGDVNLEYYHVYSVYKKPF